MDDLTRDRSEARAPDAWSPTLNVFKGLAAAAMVINHAGYLLLNSYDAGSGWLGFIVFLGSFAPVFFFFATGFGAGLRPAGKTTHWPSIWKKFAWLMLADQLLLWSAGRRVGMDFFGFIGISTLVVAWIQGRRYSSYICIGFIVILLLARYSARLWLDGFIGENALGIWVTGVRGLDGWSYPLSPWLVAPLTGFWSARNASLITIKWRRWLTVALIVMGALLSFFLYFRGAIFFRWGSVSVAYFVAAVTASLVVWGIAGWVMRFSPQLERLLSLRGGAVFLVVPIHYAALAVLKALEIPTLTSSSWIFALATMVLLTGLALTFARSLAATLGKTQSQLKSTGGIVLLCLMLALAWWAPAATVGSALACAFAQCMIASRLMR